MDGNAAVPQKTRFAILWLVVPIVLILAGIFIPTLDGPNSRRRAHEAVAAGNLRKLKALESEYASSHPSEGFTCQLQRLKPPNPVEADYDPNAFLLESKYAGYILAVSGCKAGPNGTVSSYRATAVPNEPGVSGVSAFCTDETGVLWYDAKGSAENCLAARRPIQ